MRGSQLVDVVAAAYPASQNGTVKRLASGPRVDYDLGETTQFADRPQYNFSGAWSLAIAFDLDALTSYTALLDHSQTTTLNGFEIRLGSGGSDSRVHVVRKAASTYRAHTGTADKFAAATVDNVLVVVFPDGQVGTEPVAYWAAGSETLTRSGTDATDLQGATTNNLIFAGRTGGTTSLDGAIKMAHFFDVALSPTEARALVRNITSIYAPANDAPFLLPGAAPGGVPVLTAPYATVTGPTSATVGFQVAF